MTTIARCTKRLSEEQHNTLSLYGVQEVCKRYSCFIKKVETRDVKFIAKLKKQRANISERINEVVLAYKENIDKYWNKKDSHFENKFMDRNNEIVAELSVLKRSIKILDAYLTAESPQ